MNRVQQTHAFIVGALLLIFGFDFWQLTTGGYPATISFQSYKIATEYPIVTLCIGIIAGHLWWPQYRQDFEDKPK